MADLKFDRLRKSSKFDPERLWRSSSRVDADRLWWVGAAVAGALLIAVLPRLIPQTDDDVTEPYPRYAEHAEV